MTTSTKRPHTAPGLSDPCAEPFRKCPVRRLEVSVVGGAVRTVDLPSPSQGVWQLGPFPIRA